MDGVTVYINGMWYYFEETIDLVELLDSNCNDTGYSNGTDNIIEFDAEEFCEWESTESLREKGIQYSSDGLFKPSCNNNEDDFRDWEWIRHFRFCPYCGKKIEIKE